MYTRLNKIAIIIALISISSAQAKLYSWVDSDGKTHFSDRKSAEMYSTDTVNEVDVKVHSSDLTLGVSAVTKKSKETPEKIQEETSAPKVKLTN